MFNVASELQFFRRSVLFLLICAFIGQGCNITKFLEEDDYLIRQVKVNIKGPDRMIDYSDLKDELEKLHKIKPNHNRKSYNYLKYKDVENPGWPSKWIKNKRAEPPSLLNLKEVENSTQAIQDYLRNKKGYYQAKVDHEINYMDKSSKADVIFKVQTGDRYTVNQMHHISRDSSLAPLLKEISFGSLIKPGDPIDALTFDLEKQRIVSELQRNGYADFNLTNVEIQGDSTSLDKSWDIFMTVLPQEGNQAHQAYRIGDINVYTDSHQYQQKSKLESEDRYGKTFHKESDSYVVRPSTINRKIYLEEYDNYDSDTYYKTLRKLYNLSAYRFAKVSTAVNESDPSLIDYNIFLTPHDSKWILDLGLESFFSTLSVIDDELIGIAASVGIEDRNMFGGSERFKASLQAGVEFNPTSVTGESEQRLITSRSLGLNTELQIPTLTRPFNVLRPLHRIGVIKDKKMRELEEEGVSHLRLGFNYLDILQYYKIFSRNVDYGYDFVLNKRNEIQFNQAGLNYTTYDIDNLFRPITANNPVLRNSFVDNLFTGFLFRDLTYIHSTERGVNRSNFAFITSLELSGLEVHFANSLSNAITGNSNTWKLNGDTEFEKMFKLEFDAIWYSRKRRMGQLASRFKTGIAVPFGADNTVSYIKQFFVGGPSSIRAWRPMHVGPGTFVNGEFFYPTSTTTFYQRGDFTLEMNLEYRFDLLWLMEGALFVDVGNIWTLGEDMERPGSQLSSSFIDELAIGYGYGLRFDFTYFLIRFDLGLKLRYPSIDFSVPSGPQVTPTSRWISPKGQKLGNFNIAVAYPF